VAPTTRILGVVLVCALTIACANECGCSVAAPVSFVNPLAQKRKVFDISSGLRAIMQPGASMVLHKKMPVLFSQASGRKWKPRLVFEHNYCM
jgi:hypothetical protein